MIIFRKAAALSEYISSQKNNGLSVGFVPTMGALHNGHLSLIAAAHQASSIVVSSIFVNSIQFNNKEDFARYPVTIEKDIELLTGAGCHVLFLPSDKEVYPQGYLAKNYDLGELEILLEGAHRPGHFQGVCQVVDRLLDIVGPNKIYLGLKDYQQCLVIKKLIQLTGRQTVIHITPTKREASGLAMSSRNLRLNNEQKEKAILISEVLNYVKQNLHSANIPHLAAEAESKLAAAGFIVDYVSIADAETLRPATNINHTLVVLIAATLDGVRLIDNEILNSPSKPAMFNFTS